MRNSEDFWKKIREQQKRRKEISDKFAEASKILDEVFPNHAMLFGLYSEDGYEVYGHLCGKRNYELKIIIELIKKAAMINGMTEGQYFREIYYRMVDDLLVEKQNREFEEWMESDDPNPVAERDEFFAWLDEEEERLRRSDSEE